MVHICNLCEKVISTTNYLHCSACDATFDLECITKYSPYTKLPYNIPQVDIELWYCFECERDIQIWVSDENPVITIDSDESSKDGDETALVGNINDLSEEKNYSAIVALDDQSPSSSSSSEIDDTNEHCHDLISHVQYTNRKYGTLKDKYTKLKKKSKLFESSLRGINRVQWKIRQSLMQNEIEILGVPESPSENIIQLLVLIANKIGVNVVETEIDFIQRIRLCLSKAATYFDHRETMHNPILVRFVRQMIKMRILDAFKDVGPITTEYIVKCEPRPIGIYERIVRPKQKLFREAYYRANLYNLEKCWVSDGNIYVQEQGKASNLIESYRYMDAVIGRATPPPRNVDD